MQEEKKLRAEEQNIIIQGMGAGRGKVNHCSRQETKEKENFWVI